MYWDSVLKSISKDSKDPVSKIVNWKKTVHIVPWRLNFGEQYLLLGVNYCRKLAAQLRLMFEMVGVTLGTEIKGPDIKAGSDLGFWENRTGK